jgi:hypothetical protein
MRTIDSQLRNLRVYLCWIIEQTIENAAHFLCANEVMFERIAGKWT